MAKKQKLATEPAGEIVVNGEPAKEKRESCLLYTSSLRPRRDGVRRGLRAPAVGGSPGSGNALPAGMRPCKMG